MSVHELEFNLFHTDFDGVLVGHPRNALERAAKWPLPVVEGAVETLQAVTENPNFQNDGVLTARPKWLRWLATHDQIRSDNHGSLGDYFNNRVQYVGGRRKPYRAKLIKLAEDYDKHAAGVSIFVDDNVKKFTEAIVHAHTQADADIEDRRHLDVYALPKLNAERYYRTHLVRTYLGRLSFFGFGESSSDENLLPIVETAVDGREEFKVRRLGKSLMGMVALEHQQTESVTMIGNLPEHGKERAEMMLEQARAGYFAAQR